MSRVEGRISLRINDLGEILGMVVIRYSVFRGVEALEGYKRLVLSQHATPCKASLFRFHLCSGECVVKGCSMFGGASVRFFLVEAV